MKKVQRFFDFLIISLIIFAFYVYLSETEFITSKTILVKEEYIFTLTGNLVSVIVGAITTLFGILIAVYLLFSQTAGRKPYSRLVQTFYDKTDIGYLGVLFLSTVLPVYVMAFWAHIVQSNRYYLLDVCLILYTASILSLISIMLKHLSILNPKLIANRILRDYNFKNVLAYGLILVKKDNQTNDLEYQLKTWGHRHNLLDPLGSFHDILMEAIEAKERITFHLYLSVLIEKLALLNGVRLERKFGIASGKRKITLFLKIPVLFRTKNLEKKIQVTVHALHYIVRRAKKMIKEWGIDTCRQIFIINIADLINALSKRHYNAVLIEICLYALLRICIDYKEIQPYGSYEPLKDLFGLAYNLKKLEFVRESKICLQMLAFIDANTHFLSQNKNVDINDIFSKISQELVMYYNTQKVNFKGKSCCEVFEKSIWKE